jgi:hypothetical protein
MNLRTATALAAVAALLELSAQMLGIFAPDVYHELSDSLRYVFVFSPCAYLLFFATLFFKQGEKKS